MEPDSSQLSPNLLNDLTVRILSRLPVKSLVRFRCTSKSWNSLIHRPSFIKLHLHTYSAKRNDAVLIASDHLRVVPYHLPSLLHNPSSTISHHTNVASYYQLNSREITQDDVFVGSCNGLVCLCVYSVGIRDFHEYRFLFWNPATRVTSSPTKLHIDWQDYVPTRHMMFMFGFGYDDSTDTYKLVAVICGSQPQQITVKIFDMGGKRWRNISAFPIYPVGDQGDAQFVGGAMNWLAKSDGDRDAVIASLDLRTETYKQLVLPPGEEEGPPPKCRLYGPGPLGVLRDSLCYFHDYAKTHFVIWQMKEFGDEKSWTRLVKIQIGGGIGTLFPLCMSENGDVVMLANHKYREAIRYNKSDNTIKRTRIPNRCLDAKDYVRSLALPR